MNFEPVLLKYTKEPQSHTIDFYLAHNGYKAAEKVVKNLTPEQVTEEVKKSGLRGRGGAGFPCGVKWSFIPKVKDVPKFLVCNADEGEPGTFKDRILVEKAPHQLLEGIIIACFAVGINTAYIYVRGEFVKGAEILNEAVVSAHKMGFLGKNIFGTDFNLEIYIHRGAGSYICGEETAMLSSIEGQRGNPRIRPPFPAVEGLFKYPTVINNVETLSNLPHILQNGAQWYRQFGTEKSTGTKIFCVSGHVKKPGLYELPIGIQLSELIYTYGGGVSNGKKLKAVLPGGTSTCPLKEGEFDVKMDFESLAQAGTMLGTGAVIVMDESVCMVNALWNILKFYHHESCGQCTPCREGTGWLEKIIGRIEKGKGKMQDLNLIEELCNNMIGKTICVMADAAAVPAKAFIRKFQEEFEYHIKEKKCLTSANFAR
jgi:NADH-quinone oxidoreductase subunit F